MEVIFTTATRAKNKVITNKRRVGMLNMLNIVVMGGGEEDLWRVDGGTRARRGAVTKRIKGEAINMGEMLIWWFGVRATKYENMTIIPPT